MALMNCSGCGAKVSDRARYCIHCKTPTGGGAYAPGYHAPGYSPPQAPSFQNKVEPPKKRTGLIVGIIIGIFVLLAVAVLVYIFYFDGFSNEEANAANEPSNQIEATVPPVVTPPPAQEEPGETPEETLPPTQEEPSEETANNEVAAFLEEHRVAIYDMTLLMQEGLGADGRVEIIAGTGNELIYSFFYGSEFESVDLTSTIAATLANMGSHFEMLANAFRVELGLSYMRIIVYYYDYAGNVLARESFSSTE